MASDPGRSTAHGVSAPTLADVLGEAALARESTATPRVERDEILDGRTRIVGYRFRARPAGPGALAPAMKMEALRADNLAGFAQHRLAVVPLNAQEWNTLDYRQFVTPNTTFHLAAPPATEQLAWQQALEEIKASGGGIALDADIAQTAQAEALEFADIAFVHPIRHSAEALERLIADLRRRFRGISIAADGIVDWPQYRSCLAMGVHYCLGGFTTLPYTDDNAQRQSVLDDVLDQKLVQFSWYRVFECGQEEIDRDHHALFALATDLTNAVIGGKPAARIGEIIDTLLRKVAEHFANEEAILFAAGYVRAAEHAAIHRELAARAAQLADEFRAGGREIGTVFQFLAQDLIVGHMLRVDRDFFPLFAQRGSSTPR